MRPVWLKRVWLLQFLLNMTLSNFPMELRLTYSSAADILQSSCQDILWSGCFMCWVYIQAGGRLEECRRASYKKKKTLQIALSAFPLPLSWGKYCQRQSKVLLLFHSHLFVEARTLYFYSNQQSLFYIVVFLKEGANYGVLCGHSSHLTSGTLHSWWRIQGTSRKWFMHLKL